MALSAQAPLTLQQQFSSGSSSSSSSSSVIDCMHEVNTAVDGHMLMQHQQQHQHQHQHQLQFQQHQQHQLPQWADTQMKFECLQEHYQQWPNFSSEFLANNDAYYSSQALATAVSAGTASDTAVSARGDSAGSPPMATTAATSTTSTTTTTAASSAVAPSASSLSAPLTVADPDAECIGTESEPGPYDLQLRLEEKESQPAPSFHQRLNASGGSSLWYAIGFHAAEKAVMERALTAPEEKITKSIVLRNREVLASLWCKELVPVKLHLHGNFAAALADSQAGGACRLTIRCGVFKQQHLPVKECSVCSDQKHRGGWYGADKRDTNSSKNLPGSLQHYWPPDASQPTRHRNSLVIVGNDSCEYHTDKRGRVYATLPVQQQPQQHQSTPIELLLYYTCMTTHGHDGTVPNSQDTFTSVQLESVDPQSGQWLVRGRCVFRMRMVTSPERDILNEVTQFLTPAQMGCRMGCSHLESHNTRWQRAKILRYQGQDKLDYYVRTFGAEPGVKKLNKAASAAAAAAAVGNASSGNTSSKSLRQQAAAAMQQHQKGPTANAAGDANTTSSSSSSSSNNDELEILDPSVAPVVAAGSDGGLGPVDLRLEVVLTGHQHDSEDNALIVRGSLLSHPESRELVASALRAYLASLPLIVRSVVASAAAAQQSQHQDQHQEHQAAGGASSDQQHQQRTAVKQENAAQQMQHQQQQQQNRLAMQHHQQHLQQENSPADSAHSGMHCSSVASVMSEQHIAYQMPDLAANRIAIDAATAGADNSYANQLVHHQLLQPPVQYFSHHPHHNQLVSSHSQHVSNGEPNYSATAAATAATIAPTTQLYFINPQPASAGASYHLPQLQQQQQLFQPAVLMQHQHQLQLQDHSMVAVSNGFGQDQVDGGAIATEAEADRPHQHQHHHQPIKPASLMRRLMTAKRRRLRGGVGGASLGQLFRSKQKLTFN